MTTLTRFSVIAAAFSAFPSVWLVVHAQTQNRRPDPAVLLQRLDANGDGELSKGEFKKLGELGQGKFKDRPEVFDRLFERLDADGNGTLSAEEFKGLTRLRGPSSSPTPIAAPAPQKTTQSAFARSDVAVGDPNVSYASTEFTTDGKYFVWMETAHDGAPNGVVWHCGVNPDTGDLIPPDGKGFRAFDSTLLGRAQTGRDSQGSYYVGLNRTGQIVLVRPTSATTGAVTILPTAADTTRRGTYATDTPDQPGGYVSWIKNDNVAGGPGDSRNRFVELRYLSLADPSVEVVLQHQERPPARGGFTAGFAPLDIVFPRWFRGRAALTSGIRDTDGHVQVVEFDFTQGPGAPKPRLVTNDAHTKADAFPWTVGNQDVLMPGIDPRGSPLTTLIYTRPVGTQFFTAAETITASPTTLANPGAAQSNESIQFGGLAYTAFQVNDRGDGSGFFNTTFQQTGEIWLSSILQTPQQTWRLSEDSDTRKFEPEPYVGRTKVWVFYTSAPKGSGLTTAVFGLRRCETPLRDAAARARRTASLTIPKSGAGADPALKLRRRWSPRPCATTRPSGPSTSRPPAGSARQDPSTGSAG